MAGSISALSGSVTITRAGTTIPAVYGAKVNVGDQLTTSPGASATITLTDNSQMELTDSSTLTIDENTLNAAGARQNTKVTLLTGLLRSLVRVTPGTPPNYEVHTPNAVASARGTNYDVDHHTGVTDKHYKNCFEFTHVAVFDGTVQVYNPTNPTAAPVDVHAGQKVTVPCGGAPLFGTPAGIGTGLAIGGLTAAAAGGIAVAVLGATGGFGSHHHHPTSPNL